jgi:hypothetical protein
LNDHPRAATDVARGSVRAIAKAQGSSVAQVNRVIDAWAEEAIDDQSRKRVCVSSWNGSTS